MILVAFIPGTRSTLVMQCLRGLGADLLRDRLPIRLLQDAGVQGAIEAGDYKVIEQTDDYFEIETRRLETNFVGSGIDASGWPANAAVKLLAFPAIEKSKITPSDKIIFIVRKAGDTCRSQEDRGFLNSCKNHRLNYMRFVWHFEEAVKDIKDQVFYLDSDDLVSEPEATLQKLKEFCGLDGDVVETAKLIDKSKVRESREEEDDDALNHYNKVRAKCQ